MLFVGFAFEIGKGVDLDPVSGDPQVQPFSLRQLHGDISAGIGQLKVFTHVSENDIDVPAAGGSIQTAGKFTEPDIATRSPGLQFPVDLFSPHIPTGSTGPDISF